MGDRTQLIVRMRKSDFLTHQTWIEEYLAPLEEGMELDDFGHSVTLQEYDANYGGCSGLEELAQRGVPFSAEHAAGAEYSAHCYAYDGGDLEMNGRFVLLEGVEIAWQDCAPVVRAEWDGTVKPGTLQELSRFCEYRAKVESMIEGSTS